MYLENCICRVLHPLTYDEQQLGQCLLHMAGRSNPWVDINGGDAGRSKRLCTGLGNAEPWPAGRTQWDGSQILSEQSIYHTSHYESNVSDASESFTSAVDIENVSRQHVGDFQGQFLFQSHQSLPCPLSHHNPRPSWLEVVDSTPSPYHRVPVVQTPPYPTSRSYDSLNPPSSVTSSRTATSDIPQAGDPHHQYQQSGVGTTPQDGFQDPATDGASDFQNSGDTGIENTSYELCLGLVGQICFRDEILGRGLHNSSFKPYQFGPRRNFGAKAGLRDWLQPLKFSPCLVEQSLGSEPKADLFTDQHSELASIKCHIRNPTSRPFRRQVEHTRSSDHCPLCSQKKQWRLHGISGS